jgi:hypothetical protein
MPNVLSFKEFLNESYLQNNHYGPTVTYYYEGNPSLQMPSTDLLESLRAHYKMSKKEFPTNKKEFNPFARARGNMGKVTTADGYIIEWSETGSNTTRITIRRDDKDLRKIQEMDSLVQKITATHNKANPAKEKAWDLLPEDVRTVLAEGFVPPLTASHMVYGGDKSATVDTFKSQLDRSALPAGYTHISNPSSTGFSVRTPKRRIDFKLKSNSNIVDISW